MQDHPPAWTIALTALLAAGLLCAGLVLTAPTWAHLVPGLPARAARATPTPSPSPTPTRFELPSPSPTPTRPPLIFPTRQPTTSAPPTVEPATTAGPPPPADRRLVGQGDSVVEFSLSEGGLVRFTISHNGERYFGVWLLDNAGERVDLLANEVGNYNGETSTSLEPGRYFLEIEGDGQWLINVIAP